MSNSRGSPQIDLNKDYYTYLENLTYIFGKTGMSILKDTKIPQPDYMILKGYLELISDINKKIAIIEAEIDKRITPDKDIELLKAIPGIGKFIAFVIKSEIYDINKFISKEKFTSYVGLGPSVHQSGPKSYTGKITKQGNKFIRWTLTEAAQATIRYSAYFRYYYNKVRAKQGAGSATISVARRTAEIVYVLLKEKRSCIEKQVIYS